jgi:hypothetical protein
MFKQSKFSHNGREFEVRAEASDNRIKVRLFENDKLASPAVYGVDIETVFDAQISGFPLNLVHGLMALIEDDTVEGRLFLFPK